MPARFEPGLLERLRGVEEIEILTRRRNGPPRRTVIWVMVDEEGRVLIRSVRGPRGQCWREARAEPRITLDLAGELVLATAELADDADRVAATGRELRRKYAGHGASLAAMLRDETLPTTLELFPRP